MAPRISVLSEKLAALFALVALAAGACSQGPPPPLLLDVPLTGAQARAGVVTRASELMDGPAARGGIGDFKLYNARVAFIVQAADTARGWGPFGGGLIDAARLTPGTTRGIDRLAELIPVVATASILIRALKPIGSTLVADGKSGGPAIVRIEAVDSGFPIFDAGADPIKVPALEARVVTDYVLEPGADFLRIKTTVENRARDVKTIDVGEGVLLGDGITFLAPGIGRRPQDLYGRSDIPMITGGFPGEVSYGLVAPGRSLSVIYGSDEIMPVMSARFVLQPLESATVERLFAVGSGSNEEVRTTLLAAMGTAPTTRLEGTVKEPGGTVVALAQVEIRSGGMPETVVVTDGLGRFSAQVSAGARELVVRSAGRASKTALVTAPDAAVRVEVPQAAILRLTITGQLPGGAAEGIVPARVEVTPQGAGLQGGTFYTLPEEEDIPLEPGRYRVVISRGMEYEPFVQEVSLVAGAPVQLAATLLRVVDTTGFLAADFHLHASPSVDSDLSLDDRVRSCAGEGLEFAVATDHDVVTDYRPHIESQSLSRFINTTPGTETSPLYGHFNGYPLTDPGGYWPVRWYLYGEDGNYKRMMDPVEVFAGLRRLGARVIQMNHARSTSSVHGVMNSIEYDPARGYASVAATKLDRNFDAYEVMNARQDSSYEPQLADWYSFLRQGHHVTAVATSDAHGINNCGYPRTYVQAGDDPAAATGDSIADAILAQKAIAAAGPFVTLAVGNKGLGEVAPAPGGAATVRVRVQAPSFVKKLRMEVMVNGASAVSRELDGPAEGAGVVRFDGELPVTVTRDAFVTVKVTGTEGMSPVYGGTPFTVTNPVYLDVDGDGKYTPAP